ncbi:MAG: hypothetical protein JEZ08_10360 [Clostridiales bacterium]|nr:hypothetical protein [Clostridiales bacterium]
MFKKMDIVQGITDTAKCIVKDWNSYILYMILQTAVIYVYANKLIEHTSKSDFSGLDSFIKSTDISTIIMMSLVVCFILLLIQVNIIKTTDDLKENQEHHLLFRIGFIIGKLPKLIGVWIILMIPAATLLFISIRFIPTLAFSNLIIYLIVSIVLVIYAIFISFVNHAILISGADIFDSIEESFTVVKSNFFRYLVVLIGIGVVIGIISVTLYSKDILVLFINSTLNTIVNVIGMVLITILYKQVQPYNVSYPTTDSEPDENQ